MSIIIVNYNGAAYLKKCIESVRLNVGMPYEIIVWDNGSTDESISHISGDKDVRILGDGLNHGFGRGNNLAAAEAVGNFLLFLNNDTLVESTLVGFVERFKSNNNIGVLGFPLVYGDGRRQESIGRFVGPVVMAFSWFPLGTRLRNFLSFNRTLPAWSPNYAANLVDVDWVSGACFLCSKESWNLVGGFDEEYFMYMEDTDLCLRFHSLDLRVCYTATGRIVHYEGSGRDWVGERALMNTLNSYEIFYRNHYGFFSVFILRALLLPIMFLRGVAFISISLAGFRSKLNLARAFAFFKAGFSLIKF